MESWEHRILRTQGLENIGSRENVALGTWGSGNIGSWELKPVSWAGKLAVSFLSLFHWFSPKLPWHQCECNVRAAGC